MDSRGRTAAVGHARPCEENINNSREQIGTNSQPKNPQKPQNEPPYAAQTGE